MTFFVYLFTALLVYIFLCCTFIFWEGEPEQLEGWTEPDIPTDPRPLDEDLRLVAGGNCVAVILRNSNPLGFDNVITKR